MNHFSSSSYIYRRNESSSRCKYVNYWFHVGTSLCHLLCVFGYCNGTAERCTIDLHLLQIHIFGKFHLIKFNFPENLVFLTLWIENCVTNYLPISIAMSQGEPITDVIQKTHFINKTLISLFLGNICELNENNRISGRIVYPNTVYRSRAVMYSKSSIKVFTLCRSLRISLSYALTVVCKPKQ